MPPKFKLKCLHCCKSGNTKFHEIFDEAGIDLQLDALLQEHFQLSVSYTPTQQQVLCEQCVNELIELFDESERQKEQSQAGSDNLDGKTDADTKVDVVNNSKEVKWECLTEPEISADEEEFFEIDDSLVTLDTEEDKALNVEAVEESKEDMHIVYPFVELNVFDDVDLQPYADSIINSNLEEIHLERKSQCSICLEKFEYHQDMLAHIKLHHVTKNGHFLCSLENCEELLENERILARHMVLRHYDLYGISIFGACPDCEMTFSNFMDFNKHSCCRTLKNRGRILNYCKYCEMEFPTFRKYRFHLQFHMTKRRPKICLLCDKYFNNVDKFFKHVYYEHEPADRLICVKCDRIFNNKALYETHLSNHNLPKKFKCNNCSKSFAYKFKLKSHLESHHNKKEPFKCEICSKDFLSKANYRHHLKTHEPSADVQVNICSVCGLIGRDKEEILEHQVFCSKCSEAQIDEEILVEVFVCEYCEQSFKTRSDLKMHRASGIHLDKVYHCPFCTVKFDELRKLRVHFHTHKMYEQNKNSFPLIRQYMCDAGDCEYSNTTWMSLNSHRIAKHKELQLICEKCNKRFNKRDDFDIHTTKCKKDGKHYCQFCEKLCPTKMSLSVHIARSHNNKNVKCSICNACFKDEESLQKHIEFEHEEAECNLCNKKIKNKRNLLLHQRIVHFNDKRFFCEICKKGFFNKSDMEAHIKMVHPSTSYKCSECAFETNYEKSMEIHMARHNNNFKFKCTICSKEFTRESVMKLHMKRHQSKREFMCKNCDASFVTRWLLNRHIKNKHTESENNTSCIPTNLSELKLQKMYRIVEVNASIVEDNEANNVDNFDAYISYEDDSNGYINDYDMVEENSNQHTEDVILEFSEESKIFP